jgi:hypothetical protein
MSDLIGFNRIKDNSKEDILKICKSLLAIIEKIIKNPYDEQNRRLKLESEEVSKKLMPYSGGLEVLFEMGFEEVFFINII